MPTPISGQPYVNPGVADDITLAVTSANAASSSSTTSTQLLAPLKRFHQALGAIDSTPLNWLAVGDSITESSGATKIDNGYIERVTRAIQKNFTVLGKGGFGFLNTYAKSVPSLNYAGSGINYWTFSGGGTQYTGQTLPGPLGGLFGGRQYGFAVNETATLTFTGTAARIHYSRGTTSQKAFTVAVDGGGDSTVTPLTTGGFNNRGVYDITGLSSGQHNVVLTPTDTFTLPITGATLFDGDETNGIRLLNHAQFGIHSTSYASVNGQGSTNYLADILNLFPNPALVTIHLGTNDPSNSVTPATTALNFQTIITRVKAGCTITPSFLVIIPTERAGVLNYPWTDYVTAMKGVASADSTNVGYINLNDVIIDKPSALNNWNQGINISDGVHFTDSGYKLMAQIVLGALTDRVAQAA